MFRSRPPDLELHLKINNAEIPKVTATKFLGIIIDDRLNWKPQIQSVKSKLSRILYVMYKASKLVTTAGIYTLYCSLFQPYISYCNEIWGNNYALNVKCLCVIRRKAVRLICNVDRLAHRNELYKELYILKLPEFVQYNTAILMFHLFHGTLPIHLQNRFTIYSTTRSTRRINTFGSSKNQHKNYVRLSVYGLKLWNSLPNNLRDCKSVIIFKRKLKKYFISIY